jgi:hypothetical protein
LKRGFHNSEVADLTAITSKPVDLKIKVEINLKIAIRLAESSRVEACQWKPSL